MSLIPPPTSRRDALPPALPLLIVVLALLSPLLPLVPVELGGRFGAPMSRLSDRRRSLSVSCMHLCVRVRGCDCVCVCVWGVFVSVCVLIQANRNSYNHYNKCTIIG